MDTELKKLKKLAAFMKKEGFLELESGQIKLKLSPQAYIDSVQSKHKEDDKPPEEPKPQYTQEQILMWSTPGMDSFGEEDIH